VLAALYHHGVARDAVHQLKYRHRPELARSWAGRMAAALQETALELGTCDGQWPDLAMPRRFTFVPVPIHPTRLRQRGYNQSGLLARYLARQLRQDLSVRCLSRQHNTRRQAGLKRRDRAHNLQGAFTVRQLPKRPVVLVDDVFTTGATGEECIRALREAGGSVRLLLTATRAERAVRDVGRTLDSTGRPVAHMA
jgi:ComF family protein